MTVCPPHYWKIDTPAGPTSRGVCQHCGIERDFFNYYPEPAEWVLVEGHRYKKLPPMTLRGDRWEKTRSH